MTRRILVAGSAFAGATVVAASLFMSLGAQAASPVESRVFGGRTYYKVTSTNPALDSGNEVCAAVGGKCMGFAQANNAVCKLFHPNARMLMSVNGSKYDFYCDGAPQQDIACSRTMNTCQTCPACNPNNDCASPIGQHYREMYVYCSINPAKSSAPSSRRKMSSKSSRRKMPPSSKRHATIYSPLPMPVIRLPGNRGQQQVGGSVMCTFSQRPLKKVTCGAFKAADTFCVLVMQSVQARAIGCQDNGNVICSLACNAPGASNLKQCAFGGVKAGNCPAPAPNVPAPGRGAAGALCQHGGDCASGWCLGVVPGREYRCSCIDPTNQWQNCRK